MYPQGHCRFWKDHASQAVLKSQSPGPAGGGRAVPKDGAGAWQPQALGFQPQQTTYLGRAALSSSTQLVLKPTSF